MRGEMQLELEGLKGWDYATRMCDAVVLPKKTPVWVSKEHNALVTAYGMRTGATPKSDVLEIYLDPEKADNGFADSEDDAAVDAYIRSLAARGWKFHKYPK